MGMWVHTILVFKFGYLHKGLPLNGLLSSFGIC
jgi:hypothetical protein